MMKLQKRQLIAAFLVMLVYAPVYLSVSVPAISALWSGMGYMIYIVVLMLVLVAMSWLMLRIDFVDGQDESPPS
jgi:hypothetical protein